MQVKIQKSVFESYFIEGDLLEVTQVLEQLGFEPDEHIEIPVEEEPEDPRWREATRAELRPGDIIRVMLDCNEEYSPERRVMGPIDEFGYVPARPVDSHQDCDSPVSANNIYSSIQVDETRRGPITGWEIITFDDIQPGDIIRVTADEDSTLLSGSLTGRDNSGRAQRTRIAHKLIAGGWKDMESRTVAMRYTKYTKIERKVR